MTVYNTKNNVIFKVTRIEKSYLINLPVCKNILVLHFLY